MTALQERMGILALIHVIAEFIHALPAQVALAATLVLNLIAQTIRAP